MFPKTLVELVFVVVVEAAAADLLMIIIIQDNLYRAVVMLKR